MANPSGRYVIVTGKLLNKPVILANIYAPNWDDEAFIKSFFSALPNVDIHNLIIGGDFNCTVSPELDHSTDRPGLLSKTAKVIHNYIEQYGLFKSWRFNFASS